MEESKPLFLSPFQFWKRCAKNSPLVFAKGLSKKTNLEYGLDSNFGSLTDHKISTFNKQLVKIECHQCRNIGEKSASVCDTHTGVITGVLETIFAAQYICKKIERNGICYIILNEKERI